jgi:hypothetical protein
MEPARHESIDFVAHIVQQDENSGEVTKREVAVQSKSNEGKIIEFAAKHKGEEIVMVNGQASWAGISKSIDRQVKSMGIVGPERPFQKPAPGEERQIFPDPQELKLAA